jgi:osmotically-inducible protein OsmY
MNFDIALIIALSALVTLSVWLLKSQRMSQVIAVALGVLMVALNGAPAIAAQAASDEALTETKDVPESVLKETSPGSQYSGIEYANDQLGNEAVSDRAIRSQIKDIRDDLAVSVSNGSVRMTGTVENKTVAQNVVDRVKNIKGVHEITFDLGLEEASNTLR